MSKKCFYEYHEQRYLSGIISWREFEQMVKNLNDEEIQKQLEKHRNQKRQ